jgi:hypothetical protein
LECGVVIGADVKLGVCGDALPVVDRCEIEAGVQQAFPCPVDDRGAPSPPYVLFGVVGECVGVSTECGAEFAVGVLFFGPDGAEGFGGGRRDPRDVVGGYGFADGPCGQGVEAYGSIAAIGVAAEERVTV